MLNFSLFNYFRMKPMTDNAALYQPSQFARATVALINLDDSFEDVLSSFVLLDNPGEPGWRARKEAIDDRDGQSHVLYGEFEVKDNGAGVPLSRSFVPSTALRNRKEWVGYKTEQLQRMLELSALYELPLNRWIAAFLDTVPLGLIASSISFRRSLVEPEIEFYAMGLSFTIRPAVPDLSTGWELRMDYCGRCEQSLATFPMAGACEAQVIYDLLTDARIAGVRRPALARQ